MNYEKIYNRIIENRKQNKFDGYIEKHHIIPKSLGGSDDKDNLVNLTAREHFLCHYLLTKIYPKESFKWYKMNHAFMMMKCSSFNQKRYFNSKLYEAIRKNFSSLMSILLSGKGNPQYGTMWICNLELKENKKIPKEYQIPIGWVKGRNIWNKKTYIKKERRTNIKQKEHIEHYWNMFVTGNYNSLNEFAKLEYPFSQPNLISQLKKYIPEYSKIITQGKTISSEYCRCNSPEE